MLVNRRSHSNLPFPMFIGKITISGFYHIPPTPLFCHSPIPLLKKKPKTKTNKQKQKIKDHCASQRCHKRHRQHHSEESLPIRKVKKETNRKTKTMVGLIDQEHSIPQTSEVEESFLHRKKSWGWQYFILGRFCIDNYYWLVTCMKRRKKIQ